MKCWRWAQHACPTFTAVTAMQPALQQNNLTASLRYHCPVGVAPGEHRPGWATLCCNCIRPYHKATPDALHGGSKAIIAVQMSI